VGRGGVQTGTLYVHVDHLGSTDVLTDDNGSVIGRMSYDPFGATRNPTWGDPSPPPAPKTTVGFTGHESDADLGLVNMKGRIYDPKVGRFLTTDPIVAEPLFGQSWNAYGYVFNNPLNHVDPTGFEPDSHEVLVIIGPPPPPEKKEGGTEEKSSIGPTLRAKPGATDVGTTGTKAGTAPQPPVTTAPRDWSPQNKFNPYSTEGRINRALFGSEPPLKDPLDNEVGRAIARGTAAFVPGLNLALTLADPHATTGDKAIAVGTDVLAVVGVGVVIKGVKTVGTLAKAAAAARVAKAANLAEGLGAGTRAPLTARLAELLGRLRQGENVTVRTVEEARLLLEETGLKPFTSQSHLPTAPAPKGTFRGDLLNTRNPTAPFVHPPGSAPPRHALNPHYNLYFHDGTKAAIIIEP
jgi:RHS repeat-associated protein